MAGNLVDFLEMTGSGLAGAVYTADADATVESRRRCVRNSQLAHDDCQRIRSTVSETEHSDLASGGNIFCV